VGLTAELKEEDEALEHSAFARAQTTDWRSRPGSDPGLRGRGVLIEGLEDLATIADGVA
jgi:hypothetical protein